MQRLCGAPYPACQSVSAWQDRVALKGFGQHEHRRTPSGDLRALFAKGRLSAATGYPTITVPAGFVSGLPVGLFFFRGPFEDGRLTQHACAFERATRARQAPTFSATPNV